MSSGHGDKRHGRRGGRSHHKDSKEVKCKQAKLTSDVDESSPVIQQFLAYQKILDAKHDKYERLVKLSRDVTIESKRTIFLLQRITGKEEEKESIFSEAEKKLAEIQTSKWKAVGVELQGEDPYQYIRAYSPGLQEYIEAMSFYHYLKYEKLISLEAVQETLVFPYCTKEEHSSADAPEMNIKGCESTPEQCSTDVNGQSVIRQETGGTPSVVCSNHNNPSDSLGASTQELSVHIPPMEYMLGIGDLTGELMRVAITSIGIGDIKKPFELCSFLRHIHDAFLLFGNASKELSRKMYTLKQSLQKVEAGCYTLQVRGSEIPKHMLADVLNDVEAGRATYCDADP